MSLFRKHGYEIGLIVGFLIGVAIETHWFWPVIIVAVVVQVADIIEYRRQDT